MLSSLVFTTCPIGDESPIGLGHLTNQTAIERIDRPAITRFGRPQWVFNVGGVMYIPIYVIVFGLIGGYLRYLYKTSRLLTDEDLRKEREDVKKYLSAQGVSDAGRRLIFFESLKDVALFFLAPILATVVWFLFSQWKPIEDSPTVLAVFSFASGLVTTEIVDKISEFTKTNLGERTSAPG